MTGYITKQNGKVLPSELPLPGDEYICPTCGKHFFVSYEWAYRNSRGQWVCSWKCRKQPKQVAKKNNSDEL